MNVYTYTRVFGYTISEYFRILIHSGRGCDLWFELGHKTVLSLLAGHYCSEFRVPGDKYEFRKSKTCVVERRRCIVVGTVNRTDHWFIFSHPFIRFIDELNDCSVDQYFWQVARLIVWIIEYPVFLSECRDHLLLAIINENTHTTSKFENPFIYSTRSSRKHRTDHFPVFILHVYSEVIQYF